MNKQDKWSQFFISVVGTAIGVALTFGLNGIVAQHKKVQDQRLTAIMVIHDIDCTIDLFKSFKQQEEDNNKLLHYAMDHRDQVDKMSDDTLFLVLNHLVTEGVDLHFDTSKEEIFNSDIDVWQNLGNMKFIDNVQDFYHVRQTFQEMANSSEAWREPISSEEYLRFQMELGSKPAEQYMESFRQYLKKKLHDKKVVYYLGVSYYRKQTLTNLINEWTRVSEENKFLIGITDRELEDYVNHIDVVGTALKEKHLEGTWIWSKENLYKKYSFFHDRTFSTELQSTDNGYWANFSGKFTTVMTYTGTWEMKEDSLIMFCDRNSVAFDMDDSGLVPAEGKQATLDEWKKGYLERAKKNHEDLPDKDLRSAVKARLDSSKDKMEWIDADGDSRYLKREIE